MTAAAAVSGFGGGPRFGARFARSGSGLSRPACFSGGPQPSRPAGVTAGLIGTASPVRRVPRTQRPTPQVVAPGRSRRFEHPVRRTAPAPRPVLAPRPVPTSRPVPTPRPVPMSRPVRRRPVVVSPPSKPAGVLRLTRRGRLVGLLMIAAIAYGAFGLGRASAAPAALASRPQSVVVQAGDSLWSIAERALPGEDPRDAVAKIESLNRLTSAQVDVGQQLRIR